jgi:hypothetical protein
LVHLQSNQGIKTILVSSQCCKGQSSNLLSTGRRFRAADTANLISLKITDGLEN